VYAGFWARKSPLYFDDAKQRATVCENIRAMFIFKWHAFFMANYIFMCQSLF